MRPCSPVLRDLAVGGLGLGLGLLLGIAGCESAASEDGETEAESGSESSSESASATESGETETETETTETETETGEPGGECGDGILDPGEVCDDGNLDDGDGCTPTCALSSCGFEWATQELVMSAADFETFTPFALAGDDLVVGHQLGQDGAETGIVWADKSDGLVYASTPVEVGPGQPELHALAVGPGGELFVARTDSFAGTVEVLGLDPDGAVNWTATRPSKTYIPDLRLSPTGELVLVNTIDVDPMSDDVELAALDPADGSELWAHSFGGAVAPNGFSSDRAKAMVLGPDGGVFVAYDEYYDWDTTAPVVVAFGPDGDPTPLWKTEVANVSGRKLEIADLDISPDGSLAVSFQRWDGTQKFWVASLDASTGELGWLAERDELGLPDTVSTLRGVAVTAERVFAVGTWLVEIEGIDVRQGYVIGLERETGSLDCVGVLDDYEPSSGFTSTTFLPLELIAADGGLYLAGYANRFNVNQVDLLLARVRP